MSILYACISAGEYDAPGFLNFSNNLEIFIKSGLAGHLKLLDLWTMCYRGREYYLIWLDGTWHTRHTYIALYKQILYI